MSRGKPSQALPRQLPRRGSFICANRKVTKRGIWQSRQALTGGVFPANVLALSAARLFPQETSAADAVFLHDPTRENAMPGGPQTARHCSIISNFSAEYAQSSAERIPIVFLRTAPQPPDAPAKHTAMPRRTGSPP